MKIKVCGMRETKNIQELAQLTPDYVGFIFFDKSKRHVADFPEIELPSNTKKVGVVVNESIEFLDDLIQQNGLDAIQLHGDETPEFVYELQCHLERSRKVSKIEIIKAFSVDENFKFSTTKEYEKHCDLFIFDTKGKGYGGTGIKYDWNILKKYNGETPFLLSGGITEKDVKAVQEFQHSKYIGVDLNSGFEDAPGLKNIEKLKTFFKEVK